MHGESEIKEVIKALLEKHGTMNMTQIKTHLHEVLVYDDEDTIESRTRNEFLIIQRIGNIVSHQQDTIHRYPEGYIVDKSVKPATFTLI